jgi:AmmeMemoRadiSam system protein A
MGAFVTLSTKKGLRGCIGNLQANTPLYVTIRDMAVEAATGDPRFSPVTLDELTAAVHIEISVLSPLRRVASAQEISMGEHGVVVRKGFNSGVYLPQVARDTGWTKEYFLSSLCTDKAGLPSDAWKDASTELYVFTAEVFPEEKPEGE